MSDRTRPTDIVTDPTVLPLADLVPAPWNPRKTIDPVLLEELAASIRSVGVIEPLLVRPLGGRPRPMFEIVAGERRYRASEKAGLEVVPVTVRELDDLAALEVALIENDQRENMTEMEAARGYAALLKKTKKGTPQIVAAKVGKPTALVVRRLKLLSLDAWLQKALDEGRLTIAHAEGLLRLPENLREEAADPLHGVVWQVSPLFDGNDEDFVPTAADLRPLADLEQFIREKAVLDHRAPDARYLQPTFGAALDELVTEQAGAAPGPIDEVDESVTELLVPLSLDPLVRSRLGVQKGGAVPLPPSQWREIKGEKDRCEFAVQGVIVHGGATGRILEVCTKKRCEKHFGKPKKTAPAGPRKSAEDVAAERLAEAKREEKKRADHARAQKVYDRALELARPAIVKALRSTKLNAALVRLVLEPYQVKEIEATFQLKLGNQNAALVLALSTIDDNFSREALLASLKPWRFNFGTYEQSAAHELEAAEKKAAAKPAASKAKAPAPKGKKKGAAKK